MPITTPTPTNQIVTIQMTQEQARLLAASIPQADAQTNEELEYLKGMFAEVADLTDNQLLTIHGFCF